MSKIGESIGNAWNQVTNQVQQTTNDIAQGVSNAIGNAEQSVADGIESFGNDMAKEIDDVGQKVKGGDFVGAVVELADVGSAGSVGSSLLGSFGIGPNDPVGKELVSGVINFMAGNSPGAVKDLGDALGALSSGTSEGGVPPSGPQTPERPSSAAGRRARSRARGRGARSEKREAAKEAAREKAELKMENSRLRAELRRLQDQVGDGYGASTVGGGSVVEQLEQTMKQIESILQQLKGNPEAAKDRFTGNMGWLEGMRGNADTEVGKLGPNATFEDLVAAFMMDVMKEKQQQVTEMMNKMKAMNEQKKQLNNLKMGSDMLKQVSGMVGMIVPVGTAVSMIGSAAAGMVDSQKESLEDSRQLLFEQLKNEMNKLQEMMQAMSNVLNAMHQGSMNAIRNIKG